MIISGKDKLLHIAACFVITAAAFLLLLAARELSKRMQLKNSATTAADVAVEYDVEAASGDENVVNMNETASVRRCDLLHHIRNNWVFAVIATTLALLIGIAKEIGDIYNFWCLCKAKNEDGTIVGCDASWADFLADVIGVILANTVIFGSLCLWSACTKRKSISMDYAMARTNSDT
jgi:hypothetical protein